MQTKLSFILIFSIFFINSTFAQKRRKSKPVKVYAKIEILMEGAYSKTAIKQKAIETAKIRAMGNEFGYAIIQGTNTQTVTNNNNGDILTSTNINAISNTLVKGEWVSDDKGYPKTRFAIRETAGDQEIWLTCEVKGLARKIETAEVAFKTFTYNCREPEKCATTQFKENESMFLYFQTPVKGFLSVFFLEEETVYRLLPYAQMSNEYESAVAVEADKEYLLFSPEHRTYFEGFGLVDEYGMETKEGQPVSNIVYVIFSRRAFSKPIMKEESGLKYTDLENFQSWINKNQGLDKDFQVQKIYITINK